jgi:hypothetical protein
MVGFGARCSCCSKARVLLLNLHCNKSIKSRYPGTLQPTLNYRISEAELDRCMEMGKHEQQVAKTSLPIRTFLPPRKTNTKQVFQGLVALVADVCLDRIEERGGGLAQKMAGHARNDSKLEGTSTRVKTTRKKPLVPTTAWHTSRRRGRSLPKPSVGCRSIRNRRDLSTHARLR